jgi:hypothetical protein
MSSTREFLVVGVQSPPSIFYELTDHEIVPHAARLGVNAVKHWGDIG